ncbi:uncharacterized protein LOC109807506 [Cajanus cajan]|uniref:uncharacterized protein LOC109807506 n=1 Tax=Cajanus cajan TaxID=3821 RepID=UPI0010FB3D62|nr:uncharacterized protein LOC109807506 [Cajanus cajan]
MQPSDQELEPHLRFEFDDFVAREALLDEEYWTAASLRAESEWENGTFKECGLRYNENYRKKFVDKEFNDIKTRCKEQDGESSTCIITVWKEEKNVKRTVIQSVVGTLDLNIRNLMLEEVVEAHDCSIINRTPLSKYGYIANLCVAKSARRMGIATKMLYFAVQRAKSNGVARVYAHVDRNNTPAQILFHNLGFEVVGLVNPLLVKNRMCLLRFEM